MKPNVTTDDFVFGHFVLLGNPVELGAFLLPLLLKCV